MTVINAPCEIGMQLLDECSVDAIVTDPPYHLTTNKKGGSGPASVNLDSPYGRSRIGTGFMGMTWDGGDIAFRPETWAHALRVLKPGGHLLAFSGTRTYHRMVCAIEDAGFEIRDQIGWAYGTGFPKSLDVSKAVDKAGGDALAWHSFSEAYAMAVSSSPMTHADIDRALCIKSSSCYWARTDHRGGMPPRHHWEKVRSLLSLPAEFERLYDEAEREVIGTQRGTSLAVAPGQGKDRNPTSLEVTAPATEAARRWQGWGTALKPAWEPIVVARKPLVGTVAENVLAHGTGAINVDGCRIKCDDVLSAPQSDPHRRGSGAGEYCVSTRDTGMMHAAQRASIARTMELGRWPANLIHDGSDEVLALFPNEGSAARFFYCAKASRTDRGEGNNHPTVKPTDLMRYLCRLVTPPGGLVLDPFTGSGSTGKAALLEGFRFIGFELSAEYAEIARRRMRP